MHYCQECNATVSVTIHQRSAKHKHLLGEWFDIQESYAICSTCEDEVYDETLHQLNMFRLENAYRNKHQHEQFVHSKKIIGISKRRFEELFERFCLKEGIDYESLD